MRDKPRSGIAERWLRERNTAQVEAKEAQAKLRIAEVDLAATRKQVDALVEFAADLEAILTDIANTNPWRITIADEMWLDECRHCLIRRRDEGEHHQDCVWRKAADVMLGYGVQATGATPPQRNPQ